jgi:L-threonylcarbamoyladenylate synthase
MKLNAADAELLSRAVQALRDGELVGIPTETVYGLAADARNSDAVRKIFALKGRPADHPLIVHIADANQLSEWAIDIPDYAYALADAFWPGPLTLILHKHDDVPDVVTGGQSTIGLRCPAQPFTLTLLQQFGGGVAAPSANKFGHISPTSAQHVRDEFGDELPIVIDGGECEVGIESTIIDCTVTPPRVLRPGMISAAEIADALGSEIAVGANQQSPRASGLLEKHYAPRAVCRVLTSAELARELSAIHIERLSKLRVLSLNTLPWNAQGIALSNDSADYAHDLYAALRELDAQHPSLILIEQPPLTAEWEAIHDRLKRAAAGSGEQET